MEPEPQSQLTQTSTPTPPQPSPEQATNSTPPVMAGKSKKHKWILTTLASIGIAGLATAAYFYVSQPKSQPAQENKDMKLLKIGLSDATLGNIYPNTENSAYDLMVNSQIFEGLVTYKGRSKITPLLATDWTNPDDRTWVFNLKKGILFHNGHSLTAQDVVYSIQKLQKGSSSLLSTIANVEAVGDLQVKITTTDPDPVLLNRLATAFIIDHAADSNAEPSLAGTGPYVVKPNSKPSNNNIQLIATDNYHGGHIYTKEISFAVEKNRSELTSAFKAGKYNIVGDLDNENLAALSSPHIYTAKTAAVTFIGMDTVSVGPLQNKAVRQAIRYALDPGAAAKANSYTTVQASQLIPEEIPGHNPNIPLYSRDTAKAKQLLKEAGYSNGLRLTLTHTISKKEAVDELIRELSEVGITLVSDQKTNLDEMLDVITAGKSQLYYLSYTSDTLDGADILSSALLGLETYKNQEAASLTDQATKTIDAVKRLKLLQDASKIADDDSAVAPLYSRNDVWAMDQPYDIVQDSPSAYLGANLYLVRKK